MRALVRGRTLLKRQRPGNRRQAGTHFPGDIRDVTKDPLLQRLNANKPPFFRLLGARITDADPTRGSCTMAFDIPTDLCHSIDIVQGGFVTAMLDAAVSHAVFALDPDVASVSTLEIKTTFLEPTRAGRIRAEARVLKRTFKTAFMEGQLYNDAGVLTATASATAKLVRHAR